MKSLRPLSAKVKQTGIFNQYARYYDLLYRDKNYVGEAGFVAKRLAANGGSGSKLLDLGCGTGRHALEFARLGFKVKGVDFSAAMVEQASERAAKSHKKMSTRPRFWQGDVRSVRLDGGAQFDAAISLFHVMSYQVQTADLSAAIQTAAAHLKPGGLFLFDFWYGPAVLRNPPTLRIKRLVDERIEVTRIAEPVEDSTTNSVVVNYHVLLKDRTTGDLGEMREQHPMRYLFLPELTILLKTCGFNLCESGAWFSDKPLSFDSWFGYVVAQLGQTPGK